MVPEQPSQLDFRVLNMRENSGLRVFVLLAIGLVLATLLVAVTALQPLPRIIWNASKSIPVGFYVVIRRQPKLGEIALISPPEWVKEFASLRSYLPKEAWLLKPVVAMDAAVVCRLGSVIFVDGRPMARAKLFDAKHRSLPTWKGCRALEFDEVFVLAKPKDSFDSRYFGPINRSHIAGTAIPLRDILK
jgi:conjugative transfer signal peptidase TraF